MYHGDFGEFLCVAHREAPSLPPKQLLYHGVWMKSVSFYKSLGYTTSCLTHKL